MANIYIACKLGTYSWNLNTINILESDKFKNNLYPISYTELCTVVIHSVTYYHSTIKYNASS